ncbi:MAG TPA: response regulator transcription factor [Planctomycetota bacterium]|nr:response regulator transcription factor [Planctomycetota bacterium]
MRTLLIDDDSHFAETIKVGLEQQGHVVDVASTFDEGDEIAVVERHDVIILDVVLGDRDGVDLCRRLRRRKVVTPILMLTGRTATSDKVRGLDAGADDYLTKPFEQEELLARLRSLLRRSKAAEGVMLQSGQLHMDVDAHRVTVGGAAVKLSTKEFALLEYMMRNPGKLLTRTMISERVWGVDYESSSNVIDVYVSSLRRKVDRGSPTRHIETIVGSGYRFAHTVRPGGDEQGVAPSRAGPVT